MLRSLKLKAVYRSDEDNILEDFYLPALSVGCSYDRAVGYFSAAMLSYAAQGLSAFVKNNGRMRLVIGGELDADDEKAMRDGYNIREISERLGLRLLQIIDRVDDALFHRRLEALAWLIGCGHLDIKIALRKRGMYHEKIGIIRDSEGDALVFQGSANETVNALLPDFNFESINVFPCWKEELSPHFTPYTRGFDRLWSNTAKDTLVIDFPEAVKKRFVRIAEKSHVPRPEIEVELLQEAKGTSESDASHLIPTIPKILAGKEFEIREHQKAALNAWKANAFQGILAHVTGSGKTITAIYGAVRLFEATQALVLGIAVPYQNLADQWVDTLKLFNIAAVPCYGSRDVWQARLSQASYLFQAGVTKFVCFVVVNRTLQTPEFQNILGQFPGGNLMWVGDECHHHGSVNLTAALPKSAKMRMGLSATPHHYIDSEATKRLEEFYGKTVSSFSLAEALEAKVITPYKYHVCAVELSEEEATAYREVSEEISRLAAQCNVAQIESTSDEYLTALLMRRSRILGTATAKLRALQEIMCEKSPHPLTLFYCGDGSTEDEQTGDLRRHVEQVSEFLFARGWKCSHFTARESRGERAQLLDSFRLGLIDALIAIRCLDEGIDVPACRTAYMLASGRNPKQFIQRRGRILRKAEGKEFAVIYDFLVTFPEACFAADHYERQLVQAELERVAEFSKLALNSAEAVKALMPVLRRYDLAHLLV